MEQQERRRIDEQFLSISFFSFLHQAAIPLSGIVDQMFLRSCDATSLGAMSIAKSSNKSINKLFFSPMSKTTIAMIASVAGVQQNDKKASETETQAPLSVAITSLLLCGFVLGCIQLVLFILGGDRILGMAGIVKNDSASSVMYGPALSYMKVQALSAPSATVLLIATNIYRGLGDASAPLIGALVFNAINFLGDVVFIDWMRLGINGSALAGLIAQTLSLVPLLVMLNARVKIILRFSRDILSTFKDFISQYSRAAFLLLGRSVARIAAFSYCSRRSALLGPVSASSYFLLYQIGFWVTMSEFLICLLFDMVHTERPLTHTF